jgi:hypothetical protein
VTTEQAYEAGRDAAKSGAPLAGFPLHDELYLAWLRGFREHQTFDPSCAHCAGTGSRRADMLRQGPYCEALLVCDCNMPAWCP